MFDFPLYIYKTSDLSDGQCTTTLVILEFTYILSGLIPNRLASTEFLLVFKIKKNKNQEPTLDLRS